METNLASHSFQKKRREKETISRKILTRDWTQFFFLFFFDDSSNEEPSDPMKYDRIDEAEVNILRGIVNER